MRRRLSELALLGENEPPLVLRLLGSGIDLRRLLEVGGGLRPPALLLQNQAQVGVCLRVARVALKSAAEMDGGLAELALAGE